MSEIVCLDDALDFDLFEGDFGEPGDSELSNRIVKGRGIYRCHVCEGEIAKGEIQRSTVWKFSGELMSYRCCNACCIAMASSVSCDYEEDDPIDERYRLGDLKRSTARGGA